jgi:hypothetical protein
MINFRQAADLGFVGTEHVLLGLPHAGGPAGGALAELDLATVEQEVRDEVDRRRGESR